jgi:hypothetical protein
LHFDPDLTGNDRLWHIVAKLQRYHHQFEHDRLPRYRRHWTEIDAAQQFFAWIVYASLPADH